jgi:putative membrane protein
MHAIMVSKECNMQHGKKLNRSLGIAALAVLFGASPVHAQSAAQSDTSGSSAAASQGAAGKTLSKGDQDIMRQMAQSNLAEIATAKIALDQSKNDVVHTFAQRMVDDHTQAQKELEQLAQEKGVKLPTEPNNKQQAAAKQLKTLQGEQFDRKYMAQGGVSDHRATHSMLEKAQRQAKDQDLKALVEKTAPIVQEHLTMVEGAHGEKSTSSGSSMEPAGSSSSSGK